MLWWLFIVAAGCNWLQSLFGVCRLTQLTHRRRRWCTWRRVGQRGADQQLCDWKVQILDGETLDKVKNTLASLNNCHFLSEPSGSLNAPNKIEFDVFSNAVKVLLNTLLQTNYS